MIPRKQRSSSKLNESILYLWSSLTPESELTSTKRVSIIRKIWKYYEEQVIYKVKNKRNLICFYLFWTSLKWDASRLYNIGHVVFKLVVFNYVQCQDPFVIRIKIVRHERSLFDSGLIRTCAFNLHNWVCLSVLIGKRTLSIRY